MTKVHPEDVLQVVKNPSLVKLVVKSPVKVKSIQSPDDRQRTTEMAINSAQGLQFDGPQNHWFLSSSEERAIATYDKELQPFIGGSFEEREELQAVANNESGACKVVPLGIPMEPMALEADVPESSSGTMCATDEAQEVLTPQTEDCT